MWVRTTTSVRSPASVVVAQQGNASPDERVHQKAASYERHSVSIRIVPDARAQD